MKSRGIPCDLHHARLMMKFHLHVKIVSARWKRFTARLETSWFHPGGYLRKIYDYVKQKTSDMLYDIKEIFDSDIIYQAILTRILQCHTSPSPSWND